MVKLKEEEISAPPKPVARRSRGTRKKQPSPRTFQPVNPILDQSTFKGKVEATITDEKMLLEKDIKRLGIATLIQLCNQVDDKEGLDMVNLHQWHIVVNLATVGSRGGNSKKDHATLGFYCPSVSTGQWEVNGMIGKELTLNYWDLQNMSVENYFNVVVHEFVHAYADLTAKTEKDRDCTKNGAHKKRFADLCSQVGWIEAVPVDGYVKLTSQITDEGRKALKKLKVTAPTIGKNRAPKKPKAKRVVLECINCELKVMVPTGKYERNEVSLDCKCLGSDNGVPMVATVTV